MTSGRQPLQELNGQQQCSGPVGPIVAAFNKARARAQGRQKDNLGSDFSKVKMDSSVPGDVSPGLKMLDTKSTALPKDKQCDVLINAHANYGHASDGVSSFEKMRAQRIRLNRERLQELGIAQHAIELASKLKPQQKSYRSPKTKRLDRSESTPARRSKRLRKEKADGDMLMGSPVLGNQPQGSDSDVDEEEQIRIFQESFIRSYALKVLPRNADAAASFTQGQLASAGVQLTDQRLKGIYSIHTQANLLACGGRGGLVSLFSLSSLHPTPSAPSPQPKNSPHRAYSSSPSTSSRQLRRRPTKACHQEAQKASPSQELTLAEVGRQERGDNGGAMQSVTHEQDPLLSCRLANGWVSSVRFVSDVGGASWEAGKYLVTSSNDGLVRFWDMHMKDVASGEPKLVSKSTNQHTHGIFCLHELGGQVVTASKDWSVSLARVGNDMQLLHVHRYGDAHQGVVKCAELRDQHTFASCGNDRSIAVFDTRTHVRSITIPACHSTVINNLTWQPTSPHASPSNLVLSTSMDSTLKLHDIRNPVTPVHSFTGYLPPNGRQREIHGAVFSACGSYVLTGGQGSERLTLFDVKSGKLVSHGVVGFDPNSLCVAGNSESYSGLLFAGKGSTVYVYRPV